MICRNDLLPKQILLNSCCCGYVECQWRAFYNIIVTYKYEFSFYVLCYIVTDNPSAKLSSFSS